MHGDIQTGAKPQQRAGVEGDVGLIEGETYGQWRNRGKLLADVRWV